MLNYKNYLCMDNETGEVFVVIAKNVDHLDWELARFYVPNEVKLLGVPTDKEDCEHRQGSVY